MKTLLSLLFLLTLSASGIAQDLHVFYDAFKDSLSYQVNGQVIDQPIVRKGSRIILHVDNYNDYLYEVNVVTEEENYEVPSTNVTSLLFGGGPGGGGLNQIKSLLGGGQGAVTDFFGGEGTEEDFSMGFAGSEDDDYNAEAVALEEAFGNFSSVIEEIGEIEEEIEDVNKSLRSALTRAEHTNFMKEEVVKLKTNSSLAPNTIRGLMIEYLEQMLSLDQGRDFNLEDLIDLAKNQEIYGKQLSAYQLEIQRLEAKATEALELAQILRDLGLPEAPLINMDNTLDALATKTQTLHKNAGELQALLPTMESQNIASLADVRYLYEEVKDHRFAKQVIINPDADITTLKISLAPIDSLRTRVPARNFTPIKVKSYGGLRVNASVGISFSSLFNKPQNYLVRDGVLFGDDLDAFSPIATSFVHFYGESQKQTSLAGTLGLGLGLGGESGTGLQNYFLGPSLVIGKGQRIVLTGGLTGTKVDRLALGLKVGDAYGESIVPLKSVYELGFFFGVSFNVLGN